MARKPKHRGNVALRNPERRYKECEKLLEHLQDVPHKCKRLVAGPDTIEFESADGEDLIGEQARACDDYDPIESLKDCEPDLLNGLAATCPSNSVDLDGLLDDISKIINPPRVSQKPGRKTIRSTKPKTRQRVSPLLAELAEHLDERGGPSES